MTFFLYLRLIPILFLQLDRKGFAQIAENNVSARIEAITAPKPSPPPRREPQADDQRLKRPDERRRQNKKRQRQLPSEVSTAAPSNSQEEAIQKQKLTLSEEAFKPRTHVLMLELALVGGGAVVKGKRSGYTLDPNVHFNIFMRPHQEHQSHRIRPWFGLRLAPFTGNGYFENIPGNYGLTYIGPIFGWGNLVPSDLGLSGDGRPALGSENESDLPTLTGFALTLGVAGVVYQGKRSFDPAGNTRSDDFQTKKGLQFDPPGAWAEFRYFRVNYGALSTNWLLGLQTGKQKSFIYAGVGFGAWY